MKRKGMNFCWALFLLLNVFLQTLSWIRTEPFSRGQVDQNFRTFIWMGSKIKRDNKYIIFRKFILSHRYRLIMVDKARWVQLRAAQVFIEAKWIIPNHWAWNHSDPYFPKASIGKFSCKMQEIIKKKLCKIKFFS